MELLSEKSKCLHIAANYAGFLVKHVFALPNNPIQNLKKCQRILHLFSTLYQMNALVEPKHFQYFYRFFNNLTYQSPWDNESPVTESLMDLCRFLGEEFPENATLQAACQKDLTEEIFLQDLAMLLVTQKQNVQQEHESVNTNDDGETTGTAQVQL